MSTRDDLDRALEPVLALLRDVDPSDPAAVATLNERLPPGGETLTALAAVVREGVDAGWLAERENAGIRFGRVRKAASDDEHSIDCVHMDQPGPGHTHPNGEIDLCFAVSGQPTFDGNPPGWTVYPPGSWHVPTVAGGVMDILYFLPGGAIRFEPRPE